MIGDYQIKELIAVGSSCKVYKAQRSGVWCALKVIDMDEDPFQAQYLELEFRCYQVLSGHPNILQVMDYSRLENPTKKDKVTYLATELAPNGSLFELISSLGGLPMPVVKSYAHQLLSAVVFMHQLGIAHRDLKLENILVDCQYNLKVMDFGQAHKFDKPGAKGISSTIAGTPSYMVPEMKLAGAYQPYACDLFSLGIIFFAMYSGHAPFFEAGLLDPHYLLLARNEQEFFWTSHEFNHSKGFFPAQFRSLIS